MSEKEEQKRIFVVHKHDARRLHYDLRLEMDGVLKSWAVPKEPPVEPGVKRLAVEVDDHDMDYADFEGEIPEGEYGAGTVEIWDRGTIDIRDRKDNKIMVEFSGNILQGKYVLVKTRMGGNPKNWLFFKQKS